MSRLIKTPDRGADQLVWLASTTPGLDWSPGEYYAKGQVARANRAADDPVLARELWDRTLAKLA
ncbi:MULTISPECIES: hypothetical protein [unclassified Mycobacterium]|nr:MULTISPECIES: hypothetical protein [unclassified Mycobacterium]OBH10762.1 hypothetical protein A9X04_19710 [Mycobacterium sp. E3247]